MATRNSREDELPWYRKIHPAILGAGALAAALGSIIGLWKNFEDPPDHVAITQAKVIERATLSEFAARIPDVDPSISAASSTSARLATIVLPAAWPMSASTPTVDTPHDPDPPVDPSDPTPSDGVVPSPTDQPTSTPSESETPMRTETVSPPPSDSATPRPPEGTARLRADLREWQPPTDEYMAEVVGDSAFDEVALPPPALAVRALAAVMITVDPNDPAGDPLPAKETAERLAKSLRQVDFRRQDDKRDPLGWIVAVNLEVRGLRGEPLLLAWSLHGFDVPGDWTSDRVAYRLTADRDQDMGSVEVWVPDLKKSGMYVAGLKLARASSGAVLVSDAVNIPER